VGGVRVADKKRRFRTEPDSSGSRPEVAAGLALTEHLALRVNANAHVPLLCVNAVFGVASGDAGFT